MTKVTYRKKLIWILQFHRAGAHDLSQQKKWQQAHRHGTGAVAGSLHLEPQIRVKES